MKHEKKTVELTDEEKAVLNLLKSLPINLNKLKTHVGLSDKIKWDKAIIGLTKNKLAKFEKTDKGSFIEII